MYCKNCGKQINSDDDYCFECQKDRMLFGEKSVEKNQAEKVKNVSHVKPILSTVLGISSFFIISVYFTVFMFNFAMGEIFEKSLDMGIVNLLVSNCIFFAMMIIGLVFGINSINGFKKFRRGGKSHPSLLVLGIIGVASSSFSIIGNLAFCIFYGIFTFVL